MVKRAFSGGTFRKVVPVCNYHLKLKSSKWVLKVPCKGNKWKMFFLIAHFNIFVNAPIKHSKDAMLLVRESYTSTPYSRSAVKKNSKHSYQ